MSAQHKSADVTDGKHGSFDAFLGTIRLDPACQGGAYTANPVEGIRRAALIYFPWMTSDDYLTTLNQDALAKAQAAAQDAWSSMWDANSMISRYRASKIMTLRSRSAAT